MKLSQYARHKLLYTAVIIVIISKPVTDFLAGSQTLPDATLTSTINLVGIKKLFFKLQNKTISTQLFGGKSTT